MSSTQVVSSSNGMKVNSEYASTISESTQNFLENSLKDLLESILSYLEKFIKTNDDLEEIETKLRDYDNLTSLLDIIKSIFSHLTIKMDGALLLAKSKDSSMIKGESNSGNPTSTDSTTTTAATTANEDYEQLEKILQKHEAEIRVHIRQNQTMKLYQENLQSKLDESENARSDLLDSTKSMISDVKRQNHLLSESISKLETENKTLREALAASADHSKSLESKLSTIPLLEEKITSLEKQLKDYTLEKQLQQQQQQHQMLQQQQPSTSISNQTKENASSTSFRGKQTSTMPSTYHQQIPSKSAVAATQMFLQDYELRHGKRSENNSIHSHHNTSATMSQNPAAQNSTILNTHSAAMIINNGNHSSNNNNNMHTTASPVKVDRLNTITPIIQSSGKENSMKSTYQRFYNNNSISHKGFKEDLTKDNRNQQQQQQQLNQQPSTHSNTTTITQNSHLQSQRSSLPVKDSRGNLTNGQAIASAQIPGLSHLASSLVSVGGNQMSSNSNNNSISNSHNNSFVVNNSICNSNNMNSNSQSAFKHQTASSSNHKRSKSHQINKMRGLVTGGSSALSSSLRPNSILAPHNHMNNNLLIGHSNAHHIASKNTISDNSRFSHHEIADIQLGSTNYSHMNN